MPLPSWADGSAGPTDPNALADPFASGAQNSLGPTPDWMSGPSADPFSGNAVQSPAASKLDALLAQKKSSGGGWFDDLKNVGGALVQSAGKTLGQIAAVPVSLGNQLGNVASAIAGRNQDDPNYRPSLSNFFGDIGKGLTAGQVVQQSHPDWSPWVKDVTGATLDLASNPLNAVAPGTDSLAKMGVEKAGQVIGDTAARAALKEGGVDLLRSEVEKELAANAAQHGGAQTLEDVLARQTGEGLGKQGTQDLVQSQLDSLANAKPGAVFNTGVLGHADVSIPGTARLAALGPKIAGTTAYQGIENLLRPMAPIEREFGKGAGDVVSQGIHSASAAKMEARAAGLTEGLEPGAAQKIMGETGAKAMAQSLVKDAPEIATAADTKYAAVQAEKAGLTNLPGTNVWVHPALDAAMKAAISSPPGDALANWDKVASVVKQLTVFNPLNAIQHNAKRATYNIIGEMTRTGADLAAHSESKAAVNAVEDLVKAKLPVTAENLAERGGLEEQAAKRAEAMFHGVMSDNPTYAKDLETAGQNSEGVLGTRHASAFAEKNGTVARGAVFLNGLDKGLSKEAAAAASRSALMDFSNVAMTPFERDYVQRLALFYKFPRQAIPAGIRFAMENPAEANLLSHVGLGVQQGARNQYGEHIGPALDTPLEASAMGVNEIAKSPLDFALGLANPIITGALDSKKRGLGDLLPPVGMVQKHFTNAGADLSAGQPGDALGSLLGMQTTSDAQNVPGPGGIPLPGLTPGVDYAVAQQSGKNDKAKAKFDADIATKAASGGRLTDKQLLSAMADKAGIDNPYGKTEKDLLQAMSDKGIPKATLLRALNTTVTARSFLGQ